ncbi:MAG: GGDEF domain-containing protein [Alcanivorax sp.]|nr:GGDEF domain-containing protein [Alcanivorax sp.]
MQGWLITGEADAHQGRILQRVLFATLAGGSAHTIVCWIAAQLDFFRGGGDAFMALFAWIWSGHLVLIGLTLLGFNRLFRDPALTLPLLWWSTAVLLVSAWHVDHVRLCVMLLFFAILQMGVFRCRSRELVLLGVVCVLAYLGIVLSLWQMYPEAMDLTGELIQWSTFALMTVAMIILSDEISAIRIKLRERNHELGQIVERIQSLAIRDELTGLYNRRYAMERLGKIREMAERGAFGVVVAYADLDHFKQINDRHGHSLGDEVLREFARQASSQLSGRDFCARFGGEEFLLVLVKTDAPRAREVLEQVRQTLAHTRFEQAPGLRVTVSIGMAACHAGEPLEDWLARADAALYQAKGLGRNRLVAGEGDE